MKWVLDVGSGHNPNSEANIFLDRFVHNNIHRGGAKAIIKENMIVADAQHLPFKSKSIEKIYSNHLIEHLDGPTMFLSECDRVSFHQHHVVPGILHHIHGELLFGGVGHNVHKYTYHPVMREWVTTKRIWSNRPKYTTRQELYLKIINMLPRNIKQLVFSSYIYILDEYLKACGISIVDYTIEK